MVTWIQSFHPAGEPVVWRSSFALGLETSRPAGIVFARLPNKMNPPWSDKSDLEVVKLHLEGNSQEARDELGRRLGCVRPLARSRNASISRPLDQQNLEELCQEATVAILSRLSRFTGKSNLTSWASGFVAHIFYKHFERTRRWKDLVYFAGAEYSEEATESGDLHKPRAGEGEGKEFWDVMNSLPPEEHKTIWLHKVDGLRFVQISELFEEPVTTTKSRYARSILKLQTRLGNYWRNHHGES